ncbi:BQ2448_7302 [Microbotryum intermedium]|uniref:BQ2448_7302 protein n=1 Tax=Microbotryum intermedium TaxID=269621 RepID=A0A238FQK1_9BASI|nr:BQ2448_7302 [Microbotryum intermedium]
MAASGRTFHSASPQELKVYFSPCTLVSTNTWQCYLNRLDEMFYPTPAKGYKARLIVLIVCFAVILGLTVVQLVLGEPFLVTHQILITAYTALVAAIVNIAYIVFEWRMVLGHRSQRDRIARRSTIYFPMVFGGMLCSFSLLQAYVVVLSRKGRTWSKQTLRSCVVAYFVCIILFTTAMIIITVIGSTAWVRLWSLYQALRYDVGDFVPTWQPGTTPAIPASIYADFIQLRRSAKLPYRTQTAGKALYTTLASLCMGLWAMIRHQLSRHHESISRLAAHWDPNAHLATNDVFDLDESHNATRSAIHTTSRSKLPSTSAPSSEDGRPKSPLPSGDRTKPPMLSTESCPSSDPIKWQGVQDLRRAGSWVIVMGGFTMIASMLFAGVLTWSSTITILPFIVIPKSGRFSTEADLPFALTNTYQAWRQVPSKKRSRIVRRGRAMGSNVGMVMDGDRPADVDMAELPAVARSGTQSSGAGDSLEAFLRSLEP